MAMPSSCSPLSLELFTEEELAATEALLSLHNSVGFSPRWLKKRKRSVPADDEDEELAKVARLSPRTPLSFDLSGGDDTPPPPTPIPPPPPAPPLPPRPNRKAPNNNSNDERCKKLAKEREQSIAALSATKLNLEQSVAEAKSQCQFLEEENAWLKQLQFQWRLAWIHQQQQPRACVSGGPRQHCRPPPPAAAHVADAVYELETAGGGDGGAAAAAGGGVRAGEEEEIRAAEDKNCPSPSLDVQRLR